MPFPRCITAWGGRADNSRLSPFSLYINGLRPRDLDRVFQANEFRCGSTLTQLRLKMGHESGPWGGAVPYKLDQVRKVIAFCPHLVAFDMKGNWAMEAVRPRAEGLTKSRVRADALSFVPVIDGRAGCNPASHGSPPFLFRSPVGTSARLPVPVSRRPYDPFGTQRRFSHHLSHG